MGSVAWRLYCITAHKLNHSTNTSANTINTDRQTLYIPPTRTHTLTVHVAIEKWLSEVDCPIHSAVRLAGCSPQLHDHTQYEGFEESSRVAPPSLHPAMFVDRMAHAEMNSSTASPPDTPLPAEARSHRYPIKFRYQSAMHAGNAFIIHR